MELPDVGDADRTYDFAVYVLECEYPDERPEIDRKYLAPRGYPEQGERFSTIPERHLRLREGDKHTAVNSWVITDEDGSVTYPLYEELASEAHRVLYVGQGKRLGERVYQQLRPSSSAKFLAGKEIKRVSSQ